MDEKACTFYGGSARIDRIVGGTFSTNDGYSMGTNLELVHDAKIVQTWRAGDWPEGHSSTIAITLSPVSSKTELSWSRPSSI